MKGLSPLVGAILVIVISLTAIVVVLQILNPEISKSKEISLFNEGKNNLITLDNSIEEVVFEGEGSTRSLTIRSTGGSYLIDILNDEIIFSFDSPIQLVAVGTSYTEDDILISGEEDQVILTLDYDTIDLIAGGEFGKGSYKVIIKNTGYAGNKQIVNVSVQ